jgi:hypothetical protein
MTTISEALPATLSLGGVLMLFLLLFSILGNSLFSFIKLNNSLDEHANFQTFQSSFLLLFRCATGEGWNNLMFDTAR